MNLSVKRIVTLLFALSTLSAATWQTKSPMPTPRKWHGGAAVGNHVYMVGGTDQAGEAFISTVEAYDPATDTWATKPPMPTPRNRTKAAALNGQLYVIGGSQQVGVVVSSVEAFDPATNTWATKAPLPTPRAWAASAVVNGKLYAIGGNIWTQDVATVEMYDPMTNVWTTKASLPQVMRQHDAAVINGKIYVMGGVAAGNLYVYDPVADTWTVKALPFPSLTDVGLAVVNDILYVIGGHDEGGVIHSEVRLYNPATDTWTSGPSLPAPRRHVQTGVVNGAIYAVGGTNSTGEPPPLTTNEVLIEATGFNFQGFFSPIKNLPTRNITQAGKAIPVKFSLGGDQGLGILAPGYPVSHQIDCTTQAPLSFVEESDTAGNSSLSYDPVLNQYIFVWKTEKAWSQTCRRLIVRLSDGSDHIAEFEFR